MKFDYGIDPTGMPVASGAGAPDASANCPAGLKWDGSKCVGDKLSNGTQGQWSTQPTNKTMTTGAPQNYSNGMNPCPNGEEWDGTSCNPLPTNNVAPPPNPNPPPNPPPVPNPPPQNNVTPPNEQANQRPPNRELANAMASRLNAAGQTMNPQAMVDEFNRQYNLPYGSQAQYYPASVHGKETIGFPEGYLSHEANGWVWTERPTGGQQTVPGVQFNQAGAGRTFQTPPPSPFNPGTYSGEAPARYSAFQFTPSQVQGMTEDLIKKMLSTTSLSPEIVAAMKEGEKGSALSMADQLKEQYRQSAATRGTFGGGSLDARLSGLDSDLLGQISSGYRNVDITKAVQDRTDQLNAAAASDAFMSFLLSQQQAQAAENYKEYQAAQAASAEAFSRWLATQGLQSQASQQAFMQWLSQQDLGEGQYQFDLNNQLAIAKWLAGE